MTKLNEETISILDEISEDIKMQQPNKMSISYDKFNNEMQIKFNNYNWSSYFLDKEDYEILKNELQKSLSIYNLGGLNNDNYKFSKLYN